MPSNEGAVLIEPIALSSVRWSSAGSIPVLQIEPIIAELEQRFGLAFETHMEDMGPIQFAAALLAGVGVLVFEQDDKGPNKRVVVYVDRGQSITDSQHRIESAMKLSEEDIYWRQFSDGSYAPLEPYTKGG